MIVSIVSPEYYEVVWPHVKDYLEGAADYTYGRFTIEDIAEGLITRPHQLWVAYTEDMEAYGAVVTEITTYPQIKALVMHFTGGKELPLWKPAMLELLQEFARNNGCDIIESYGRRGWGKVFENDGFKERFTFYELPVEKLNV